MKRTVLKKGEHRRDIKNKSTLRLHSKKSNKGFVDQRTRRGTDLQGNYRKGKVGATTTDGKKKTEPNDA